VLLMGVEVIRAAKEKQSSQSTAEAWATEQIGSLAPSDCSEGRQLLRGGSRAAGEQLTRTHALHRLLAVSWQKLPYAEPDTAAVAAAELRACALLSLQHTTALRAASSSSSKALTLLHAASFSFLASALQSSREASIAFGEARRLAGVVTPLVAMWDVLGPFQHGKTELDGDPLEGLFPPSASRSNDTRSGILLAELERADRSITYPSELPDGGVVRWRELAGGSTAGSGLSLSFPGVRWNDVAQSVSMAALETQSWLVGVIHVHSSSRIAAHCRGITHFSIDEQPLVGDVYNKGMVQGALDLARGPHIVRIRMRAKVQGQFACTFAPVATSSAASAAGSGKKKGSSAVEALQLFAPSALPDLVGLHLLAPSFVAVPVLNLSPHWLSELDFSTAPADSVITVAAGEEQPLVHRALHSIPSLAPGQLSYVPVRLALREGVSGKKLSRCPPPFSISLTATAIDAKGNKIQLQSAPVSIHLRCSQWARCSTRRHRCTNMLRVVAAHVFGSHFVHLSAAALQGSCSASRSC